MKEYPMRAVGWLRGMAVATAMACALPAFAQGGGFGAGGFGGGGGGFQIDPQQIQQRLLGNVQDQVGFTDDEWKVVQPRLWKVLSLQVQSGTGGLGGIARLFRQGRGGGGFDPNTMISQIFNNGQPLPVLQRQQELSNLLDNPGSTDMQLSAKLREYRDALAKVREELAVAQKDLQGLLTLRQEAILVEMGYLD
jgi:hypothetical protein